MDDICQENLLTNYAIYQILKKKTYKLLIGASRIKCQLYI